MITTSVPFAIRSHIQRMSSAIALPLSCRIHFWGAETVDVAQAANSSIQRPITISVHHPGVLRHLIFKQDPIALVDAYINGYLAMAIWTLMWKAQD